MFLTEFGMDTFVRPVHPWYVDITDYQLFVVNMVEK